MTRSPERRESPQPASEATDSALEPQASKRNIPPSPTHSDKSSESEGRPVREKLKETRIDAQASSDPPRSSDQPMQDVPNGTNDSTTGDQSTSGSESGRGRLRRKRSREDFEDEEKPIEKKHERHLRKKSRDVTSPHDTEAEVTTNPLKSSVSRIDEHDDDETMATGDIHSQSGNSASNRPVTPEAPTSQDKENAIISPKNKRTHDQTKGGDEVDAPSNDVQATDKAAEEPNPKRHRDKDDLQAPLDGKESKTKISPSSGFANASAASPFAALSPKPQSSNSTKKPTQDLPQTSDEKFKASGFGSFATSSASPFGGLGSSSSKSPFASTPSGSGLTSFASPSNTANSVGSGFGALGGSSNKSVFGGGSSASNKDATFGRSLGQSAFGGLSGSKSGISSFATPGANTITGLSQKPQRSFGAPGEEESEGEDEGTEENGEEVPDNEETEKPKQSELGRRNVEPPETGEEGEEVAWVGRAKLFTYSGDGKDKSWQERGVGPFKLNVSKEEPKKARFILRADGTHRLILNAAVTKTLRFGDAQGNEPKDGQVVFSTPTSDGSLELHRLRMKPERASELWKTVKTVKERML